MNRTDLIARVTTYLNPDAEALALITADDRFDAALSKVVASWERTTELYRELNAGQLTVQGDTLAFRAKFVNITFVCQPDGMFALVEDT